MIVASACVAQRRSVQIGYNRYEDGTARALFNVLRSLNRRAEEEQRDIEQKEKALADYKAQREFIAEEPVHAVPVHDEHEYIGRRAAQLRPKRTAYRTMELGTVIDALYESEINCSITSFWDNGFTAKLGDETNGFVAEKDCGTSSEAAIFLHNAAHQHYHDSTYALGRDEWERRHVTRNTGIRIVSRNEK